MNQPPRARSPQPVADPPRPPVSTVFALSSAPGRAAIAVIRMSGPGTRAGLQALGCRNLVPRRAHFVRLTDPRSGAPLDEALALFFEGPKSETGEDVGELHVHGGRAVVSAVLDALGSLDGFVAAEPGAFARRAFANGKLDLTAAEGLADLVDAETELQRIQALDQAGGRLAKLYDGWRERLIGAMGLIEAAIDFSDEADVSAKAVADGMAGALALRLEIAAHLESAHRGEILRDGFKVVIAGRPNAGKSSLMNALAGRDVAIVSEEAGTTRDLIEVRLDLRGIPVIVTDTAGIRETGSSIEREGVRRAIDRMSAADLVVWLVDPADAAEPPPLSAPGTLVVHTKRDLHIGRAVPDGVVAISTRDGTGLDTVTDRIAAIAHSRVADRGEPAPTNARHRHHLGRAIAHLVAAETRSCDLPELVAEDVRLAASELGRLTGRIDPEEVLGAIFSRFCIGK